MTQVLPQNDASVRDFSSRHNVRFKIDDDIFVGVANIPALDLLHFGVMFDGMTESQMAENPEAYQHMLELVLEGASAAKFYARMSSKDNPISMGQLMQVLEWLMEEYGMRPSQPSATSSRGSANPVDGTSSTASQSPLGLTSSNFQPPAS